MPAALPQAASGLRFSERVRWTFRLHRDRIHSVPCRLAVVLSLPA
jgi:predicted RNase H-like nuclease